MGALRYNFDLIFANLLFGANFSFYVSLTRNYLDFQQIFMLQVLAASIFFIPFALFSTLGPVFTILTGHFLLREKNITWARRIGVVLGFAGAAFLLFDKGFRLAPGSSGLGAQFIHRAGHRFGA